MSSLTAEMLRAFTAVAFTVVALTPLGCCISTLLRPGPVPGRPKPLPALASEVVAICRNGQAACRKLGSDRRPNTRIHMVKCRPAAMLVSGAVFNAINRGSEALPEVATKGGRSKGECVLQIPSKRAAS